MQWFSEPPTLNEVEISIFGPGYGESIAVHLGNGKWLLVDSCIDPGSGLPAALAYLLRLGVDVAHQVKLIVATHWHDDHIRGLSGVFNACQSADLAISSVLHSNEFRKLVALYSGQQLNHTSGADEFVRIFEILQSRRKSQDAGPKIHLAAADKLLWRDKIVDSQQTSSVAVYALSPSDTAVLLAQLALTNQAPQSQMTKRRLIAPSPNHASVALWIEIADVCLLLGADLEHTNDPATGWSAVVTDSRAINDKASMFKVPHHGSQNGHHNLVWTQLLAPTPFAIVTPFRHGRHLLPRTADIERISSLTPNAFLTAPVKAKPVRWSRRIVRDFVEQATKSIEPIYTGWGQVQLRRAIDDNSGNWHVRLFGDAYRIEGSS